MGNKIPLEELIGKRFGRLVLLEERAPSVYLNSRSGSSKKRRFLCQCDCGKTSIVGMNGLKNGSTKSCGCIHSERSSKAHKKHGQRNNVLYSRWIGMKKRCYNKNFVQFKDYGGRGIRICDEWLNDFQAFFDWAILNGFKKDLQIDRKDNNGNYSPENCRFVTSLENNRNRRKPNKRLQQ